MASRNSHTESPRSVDICVRNSPCVDQMILAGLQAVKAMTGEARNLSDLLSPAERARMLDICAEIDRLADQLADLERRGLGNSPEAHAIRNQLRNKLHELADFMKKVLTDRVVEDFADISTPLKQFVDAVYAPPSMPNRERNFEEKARNLDEHSSRCANTALLVAKCGPCKNKKTVEAIIETANQVNLLQKKPPPATPSYVWERDV